MSEANDAQLVGLSILLQISRRVREAAIAREVGFIAVNESKQLIAYRQSALWLKEEGVSAVSGVPEPDRSSPYVQWLSASFKHWQKGEGCRRINSDQLPEVLAGSWAEWFPFHGVIAPLHAKNGELIGLLLLVRDEEWQDHDLALLSELAAIYAQGFAGFMRQGGALKRAAKLAAASWLRFAVVAALVGAMFLPVRMSVQAPTEVVPRDPFVVRSPLDSVIDRFHVKPNQPVAQGDLLFEFDRTNLSAKHGVAAKAYDVAAEEYRQAAQSALVDDKSRMEITPRRGKMEEKATELSYSRQLLKKTEVRAPRSGIAVFAEQGDWVGKNVSVGERVLTIADPSRVEMLIRLPLSDAIELNLGNPVRLYLLTDPQHPVEGSVRYVSYKPETTTGIAGYKSETAGGGIAVYRIKADFAAGVKPPRIGLTGTARIYGKNVSLGYYLFRRPFTALRQRFGW
jgi:multidrug efflux pump subunit AcrA (membrane-fusion protein)